MCNEKCAKVSFMTFNVIFLLAGLGILAAGVYIRVMKTQYDAFFGSSALMIVTYIMMAAGGLVVLISLAGCVGAYTRSRLILGIYFVFLVIIFAIEAAAGIVGFLNYDKVLPVLKEYTEAGIMNKYGYQDYRAISLAIDVMQQEGCVDSLLTWGKENLLVVGGVSVGIAMIQLFGMVLSLCLCKRSGEAEESF